jgi:hypothetical protein
MATMSAPLERMAYGPNHRAYSMAFWNHNQDFHREVVLPLACGLVPVTETV